MATYSFAAVPENSKGIRRPTAKDEHSEKERERERERESPVASRNGINANVYLQIRIQFNIEFGKEKMF